MKEKYESHRKQLYHAHCLAKIITDIDDLQDVIRDNCLKKGPSLPQLNHLENTEPHFNDNIDKIIKSRLRRPEF